MRSLAALERLAVDRTNSHFQKCRVKKMRKIIVLSFITLDGVMQAPGGRKEDASEGFKYGGWSAPYNDKISHKVIKKVRIPP